MPLLQKAVLPLLRQTARFRHVGTKVTILGGSGAIAQPLALLLKSNPRITHLALYDVVPSKGVATDLSHINTHAQVSAHHKAEEIEMALEGSELVLIVAGAPRRGGVKTHDELFDRNAPIIKALCEAVSHHCPDAYVGVVTQPINMLMPLVSEALYRRHVYDPNRVFGITTLNSSRARVFVSELKDVPVDDVCVPVYGGSTDITIVPIFSQTTPKTNLSETEIQELTQKVQYGDDWVFKAKGGAGSAALSMAYAANLFTNSLLEALEGKTDVVRSVMVRSNLIPGVEYFASKVQFGKHGVDKVLPLGDMSHFEKKALDNAVPKLKQDIARGVEYIRKL